MDRRPTLNSTPAEVSGLPNETQISVVSITLYTDAYSGPLDYSRQLGYSSPFRLSFTQRAAIAAPVSLFFDEYICVDS